MIGWGHYTHCGNSSSDSLVLNIYCFTYMQLCTHTCISRLLPVVLMHHKVEMPRVCLLIITDFATVFPCTGRQRVPTPISGGGKRRYCCGENETRNARWRWGDLFERFERKQHGRNLQVLMRRQREPIVFVDNCPEVFITGDCNQDV